MLLWPSCSPHWWPGKRSWQRPIQRLCYGSTAVVTGETVWLLGYCMSWQAAAVCPGAVAADWLKSFWGSWLAGCLLWEVASSLTDWQMEVDKLAGWAGYHRKGISGWSRGKLATLSSVILPRSQWTGCKGQRQAESTVAALERYFFFQLLSLFLTLLILHEGNEWVGSMPAVVQALYQITVIKRELSHNMKLLICQSIDIRNLSCWLNNSSQNEFLKGNSLASMLLFISSCQHIRSADLLA